MPSISVRRQKNIVFISLRATLDIAHAQTLHAQLARALAYRLPVRVNMRRLERLDTAAVQVLLAFACAAKAAALPMRLAAASPIFAGALQILGLSSPFEESL